MSDKIAGTFMVPDDDIWNYFFMGAIFNAAELYDLKLDIPLTFYDELHRQYILVISPTLRLVMKRKQIRKMYLVSVYILILQLVF